MSRDQSSPPISESFIDGLDKVPSSIPQTKRAGRMTPLPHERGLEKVLPPRFRLCQASAPTTLLNANDQPTSWSRPSRKERIARTKSVKAPRGAVVKSAELPQSP